MKGLFVHMKNKNESTKMSSSRDILEKERELEAREQRMIEQEEKLKNRWRNNLYDRISVSIKTMNLWILSLSILLILAIVLGILFSQ